MTIRLVVVEDNPQYRSALQTLFRTEPGFDLAGVFDHPPPMLRLAEEARYRGETPPWELTLMDIEMPEMDGLEATRRLKAIAPSMAVVHLTVFDEPATILSAICAGSDGYILKSTPLEEMVELLSAISAGGSPLTPNVARTVMAMMRGTASGVRPPEDPRFGGRGLHLVLSRREQDVLRDLARGLIYKQIADDLGISIHTVRTYVRRIYEKLRVGTTAEAVAAAIRGGIT